MTTTDSTPASMGGPLSEAAFVEAVGRYSLDQIRAYLAGPPALIGPDHGRDLDRMAWLLDLHDSVRDKLHRVADESRQLQERLDAATARVGALEGQLATAQAEADGTRAALHRRLIEIKAAKKHGSPDMTTSFAPVRGVDEDIEDARLWWEAVSGRNSALGLDGGGSDE